MLRQIFLAGTFPAHDHDLVTSSKRFRGERKPMRHQKIRFVDHKNEFDGHYPWRSSDTYLDNSPFNISLPCPRSRSMACALQEKLIVSVFSPAIAKTLDRSRACGLSARLQDFSPEHQRGA